MKRRKNIYYEEEAAALMSEVIDFYDRGGDFSYVKFHQKNEIINHYRDPCFF
jgi:hypothetical protein